MDISNIEKVRELSYRHLYSVLYQVNPNHKDLHVLLETINVILTKEDLYWALGNNTSTSELSLQINLPITGEYLAKLLKSFNDFSESKGGPNIWNILGLSPKGLILRNLDKYVIFVDKDIQPTATRLFLEIDRQVEEFSKYLTSKEKEKFHSKKTIIEILVYFSILVFITGTIQQNGTFQVFGLLIPMLYLHINHLIETSKGIENSQQKLVRERMRNKFVEEGVSLLDQSEG